MKKFLLFSLMAVCSVSVLAGNLSTSITEIYYRGEVEQTGSITFSIDEDEFADASPSTPVYLRLTLDKNVVLSRSKVKPAKGFINLAMRVNGDPSLQINTSEDAVSIVRWRKGENAIWLKISESSSTWVVRDGVAGAPTYDAQVEFTLGVTGKLSRLANKADYLAGRANLPRNSRDNGSPASTLVKVDASESDLATTGIESMLTFDIAAFDELTEGVETARDAEDIITGDFLPVSFWGDFFIARGVEL